MTEWACEVVGNEFELQFAVPRSMFVQFCGVAHVAALDVPRVLRCHYSLLRIVLALFHALCKFEGRVALSRDVGTQEAIRSNLNHRSIPLVRRIHVPRLFIRTYKVRKNAYLCRTARTVKTTMRQKTDIHSFGSLTAFMNFGNGSGRPRQTTSLRVSLYVVRFSDKILPTSTCSLSGQTREESHAWRRPGSPSWTAPFGIPAVVRTHY